MRTVPCPWLKKVAAVEALEAVSDTPPSAHSGFAKPTSPVMSSVKQPVVLTASRCISRHRRIASA